MKKGWVKLTKDGMVDSLTTEERESENEWNEYNKTQNNLEFPSKKKRIPK